MGCRRRRARRSVALLRPLRATRPIGWIGGRYSTSKPISAMSSKRAATSAKVPWRPGSGMPSAGKSSYQAEKRARSRSTRTRYGRSQTVGCVRSACARHRAVSCRRWRRTTRSASGVASSASSPAQARRRRASALPARAAAARISAAPIRMSTLTSLPASALRSRPRRHVPNSSIQARAPYSQTPSSVTVNSPAQRSLPSSRIGVDVQSPRRGGRWHNSTRSRSWPSANASISTADDLADGPANREAPAVDAGGQVLEDDPAARDPIVRVCMRARHRVDVASWVCGSGFRADVGVRSSRNSASPSRRCGC